MRLLALVAALVAASALAPAHAAPDEAALIRIEASVAPNLQVITGTITVTGASGVRVVDPLAILPEPPDDRTALRTWPGAPERGVVRVTPRGRGRWDFVTILPRRYGDVGVLPRRTLLANGSWYPQPMVGQAPVQGAWSVAVALPPGVVGAVGSSAGEGQITWVGTGDRASLAALRGGRATPLAADGVRLTALTRGRPPRAWRTRLAATLADVRPPEARLELVVVRGPLRRRLARPGRGLAFVSDRAWRLTPGLRRYHDPAVARALLASALDLPDPFARELAAAGFVRRHVAEQPSAGGALRWFAWNPVIDAILHDRTLPFWADVLDAPHPSDPLRDAWTDLFAPHAPATAIAAQLDASGGPLASFSVAAALARGASLAEAEADADLPAGALTARRARPPVQDLTLSVDRRAAQVAVTRVAPPDAPAEVVVVRIDGEPRVTRMGPGPDQATWALDAPPRRVVLDPEGLVDQRSRRGDAWPPRFTVTTAAWVDRVNVTEGWASGFVSAWARGRDDTRNVWSISASIDQQTLPALAVGWLHRRGPLQDGLNRPHRLSVWFEPAWTNPRFSEGDGALATLGGGVGYAWDTRVDALFPLRGRRLSATVTGGALPAQGTTWATARLGATGVVSPHPRWAAVGLASLAVASGDTVQRLLWLGGPGSLASLPPAAAIGRARGVVAGELRWAPIRHASVPLLGIAWLSEVQLTAGAEAGALRTLDGDAARAAGVTAGVSLVADLLGASPSLAGVTVGWPVWRVGLDDPPHPQVIVRFGQSF